MSRIWLSYSSNSGGWFRDGTYSHYGTIDNEYAIRKYGGVKEWLMYSGNTYGYFKPTDDVYDKDNVTLLQEGTATRAEREAAAILEANKLQAEAEAKIAKEIAEAEAWARMANSTTVTFAPGVTRTDLVNVAQKQINATPEIVQDIIDNTNKQIKSITTFDTEKPKSSAWVLILIPIFLIVFLILRRK